ncbi:MAG: HAD-IIA family hydrolase [Clostridia bacterium]|nr:HAD-IIA family hydrolase [Clostridia bacterium]
MDFDKIKAFLFDLDGTLYLDDKVISGAIETLDFLRRKGKKIVYLTNNSSRTDDEYYVKLKKLGLFTDGDLVYSSLDAFVDFIKDENPHAKIYPVATQKVKKYLKGCGINVVSFKNADTLLTTYDKTLTYSKIVNANYLLTKGVKYIATHPDKVCPALPVSLPDLGSFTQLFKASSGREPDLIVGKPYETMAKYIVKKLNISPDEIVMIGDRLYTDIAFGLNVGFNTVLVYSGETDEKLYKNSDVKADFVIDSVKDIIEIFN